MPVVAEELEETIAGLQAEMQRASRGLEFERAALIRDMIRSLEGGRSVTESIRIKGAKEHNLKNVDVEIPRDKFVVITGISGSGSHRWPLIPSMPRDSESTWNRCPRTARQFLGQMKKRTWITSTACLLRFLSTKKRRARIPVLLWERSPRSSIT